MEGMNNKETKLTPRQWCLYSYLRENPDKWHTQKEICNNVAGYTYIDDERNNCVAIGDDQRAINESMVVDKIIITDKHCFKIASEEEYIHFRSKLITRIKNAVKQVQSWDLKYERNGQGKLFNNVLNELKPENEQFHETFVEEEKQEPKLNGKLAFIDLVHKVAYIVDDVWEYTLNEETHIAYVGDKSILDIYEVITMDQLERPFYEDYRKEVIKHYETIH